MIPASVIKELLSVGFHGNIINPSKIFEVAEMSINSMGLIKATSRKVYISKRALKHIIDQRGVDIIFEIFNIISKPTIITDNSLKRSYSFIFAKKNGNVYGAVVEITKTPDYENQVVSAFPISFKTYGKMKSLEGRHPIK